MNGFLTFLGGALAMFFATRALEASASDLDPEWLYWLLAISTSVLTGAVELWRQRGIESKVTDLESKVTDLRVEVMYHDKLLRDLDSNNGSSNDDGSDNDDES